jgi:hypothetical protein
LSDRFLEAKKGAVVYPSPSGIEVEMFDFTEKFDCGAS